MNKETTVTLIFRKRGLRSYIDLDLCSRCPRKDMKGCCGQYSPVFYLLDLAFLYQVRPDLIELIFSMPNLTVLDQSVTINKIPDESGFICQLLDKSSGCRLPQVMRESICRHFICCGVPWQNEPGLQKWADFFEDLANFEIKTNNEWAQIIAARGLSLRNPSQQEQIMILASHLLDELWAHPPVLLSGRAEDESVELQVTINPDSEWIL